MWRLKTTLVCNTRETQGNPGRCDGCSGYRHPTSKCLWLSEVSPSLPASCCCTLGRRRNLGQAAWSLPPKGQSRIQVPAPGFYFGPVLLVAGIWPIQQMRRDNILLCLFIFLLHRWGCFCSYFCLCFKQKEGSRWITFSSRGDLEPNQLKLKK